MAKTKASVYSLLKRTPVRDMALPSNVRYGTAIRKRGGVVFITYSATEVSAWVGGLKGSVAEGGSQRRRTRLYVTADGLAWHCSGNPRKHQVFCKHCVALALAILRQGGRSRT